MKGQIALANKGIEFAERQIQEGIKWCSKVLGNMETKRQALLRNRDSMVRECSASPDSNFQTSTLDDDGRNRGSDDDSVDDSDEEDEEINDTESISSDIYVEEESLGPIASVEGQVSDDINKVSNLDLFCTPIEVQRDNSVHVCMCPEGLSQSHLGGRNGSFACTLITVIFATVFNRLSLNLSFDYSLPSWLLSLLLNSIKSGNLMYDEIRFSLPSRLLSVEEAVSQIEHEEGICCSLKTEEIVWFENDHHLSVLKNNIFHNLHQEKFITAILIFNEKSTLIIGNKDEWIIFVDTHNHGTNGSALIWTDLISQSSYSLFYTRVERILKEVGKDMHGTLTYLTF